MKIKSRMYLFLATALLVFWNTGIEAQNMNYDDLPILIQQAGITGDTALVNRNTQSYINQFLLKQKKSNLFTPNNLEFIGQHLGSTDSKAFKFFRLNKEKINAVLGENKAEYVLRSTIAHDYEHKEEGGGTNKTNLNDLETKLTEKFGQLGKEVVSGRRMMHCLKLKDWANFGKYYVLYFKSALKRPEYIVNATSWYVFENVNDPIALKFACDVVMKFAIDKWYQSDANAYDTYAQLLYRNGRTAQAIEWEEKALNVANGNDYLINQSTQALKKMRQNIPTWIVSSEN